MRRYGVAIFMTVLAITVFFRLDAPAGEDITSGTVIKTEEKRFIRTYTGKDFIVVEKKKKKENGERPQVGDIIEFTGKEKNLDDFRLREFDYGRYLKSKGIKTYAEAEKIKITGRDRFFHEIGRIRSYIKKKNKYMYKKNADFLNAVVIGDRQELEKEEKYIFSDSGTSHIMAVSGLHIGIITGFMVVILGRMNSMRKFIAYSALLIFYTNLSGGGASVKRAALICIFGFASFFLERRVDIINILALIATVMIAENPFTVYDTSFQLSFLAVLSLAIFEKYVSPYVYGNIISGSISVMILTFPVILYTFKEISTVGIAGNLVAIPVIGLIMILDILSVVLYAFFVFPAGILVYINSFLIDNMRRLLMHVGDYGASNIVIEKGNFRLLVTYYILIFSLSLYLEYTSIKKNRN